MGIGRNISKLRQKKSISQKELAEKAEISVDYLSHIEEGRERPHIKTIVRIAKALGVVAEELLKKRD